MAGETITIECLDDGTYHVTSTETGGEPGDNPLDETVKTLDEVLGLVQQELSDDTDEGAGKQAWDEEAASRDATGYRQQSDNAGPAMSM